MQITAQILKTIAPAAPKTVDRLVAPINQAMNDFDIRTLHEVAMFLAQAAHETDGFNSLREYASGAGYEGRKDLGNVRTGDGKRYRGRGIFMTTGRANYAEVSKHFGIDFVAFPEKLEEPHWAAQTAGLFWSKRKLNEYANKPGTWRSKRGEDAFTTITRIVNGGLNGLADRRLKYARAIIALTPLFKSTKGTDPTATFNEPPKGVS